MGPTLLLFTWLKEKELIANSNKKPQFYCNNKAAYMTSIHVYIIVLFLTFCFSFFLLSLVKWSLPFFFLSKQLN